MTVKVWRSPDDGSFRITGGDPDLKSPGLYITVKRGSKSEQSLLALSERLGVAAKDREASVLRSQIAELSDEEVLRLRYPVSLLQDRREGEV